MTSTVITRIASFVKIEFPIPATQYLLSMVTVITNYQRNRILLAAGIANVHVIMLVSKESK